MFPETMQVTYATTSTNSIVDLVGISCPLTILTLLVSADNYNEKRSKVKIKRKCSNFVKYIFSFK